jgi:hypothetical protein
MQNGSKLGHSNYQKNSPEKVLERCETNFGNCKVTPQAIWPIPKSLSKMGGPKAPSAIHGLLGPTFYSIDKANIISGCFGTQFRAHDFCECDLRRHVEAAGYRR